MYKEATGLVASYVCTKVQCMHLLSEDLLWLITNYVYTSYFTVQAIFIK